MPLIPLNGHHLFVERDGEGEPVVLVHGAWSGQAVWRGVATELRRSYDVIAYDRLGHADSERPDIAYDRRRHEDDLIALIEHLDAGPAHLVGSSYGAAISLAVAARRPELVRCAIVHEPPLVDLTDSPLAQEARAAADRVARRVRDGEVFEGTKAFFEEIALGPGAWELLPESFRKLALSNAVTVASEQQDADGWSLDVEALAAYPGRLVLTEGDQSLAWFGHVMDAVCEALPDAVRITIEGVGHGPHTTHPVEYAALLAEQLSEAGAPTWAGSRRASA